MTGKQHTLMQQQLQGLLNAALLQVPAAAFLVGRTESKVHDPPGLPCTFQDPNSNKGRVRPALKAGKVGGAGDFESLVAVALYRHLQALQLSHEETGGVITTSAYGIQKQYRDASELSSSILEALIDVVAGSSWQHLPLEQRPVADVCIVGDERTKISFSTGPYLAAQAASGMLQCPACSRWFSGERGLSWHSQMKHKIDYALSQSTASEQQSMALSAWSPSPFQSLSAPVLNPQQGSKTSQLDAGLAAARDGQLVILQNKVQSGWDPQQITDRHGSSALLWAAGGGHLEVCKHLVDVCGCSPHMQQAKDARNALHWASRNGHLGVVEWLVAEKGINPDTPTHDGTVALHWACWQGHIDVAIWLVEVAGCDIYHKNSYGCCAVHWTAQSSADSCIQVFQYLQSAGLSILLRNINGHSPLHKAAQRGNIALVKWLICGGGSAPVLAARIMESPDNDGNLPIDCARLEGHADVAELLDHTAQIWKEISATGGTLEDTCGEALVSIIMPVHNAEPWLNTALESVLGQETPILHPEDAEGVQNRATAIEVVLWDDCSSDGSRGILNSWARMIGMRPNWSCKIHSTPVGKGPLGCGRAKNAAVAASHGRFLMFHDADDISHPSRLRLQLSAALSAPNSTLLGCRFQRDPKDATRHYTAWANSLTDEQLSLQRFRECTVIAPTWFMSRQAFDLSGGFGATLGDDMQLFHRHCLRGGLLRLVGGGKNGGMPLLTYRHHSASLSGGTSRGVLLKLRSAAFVQAVLEGPSAHGIGWDSGFTVWNAGRDGRQFVASLPIHWSRRCKAFCDVDEKKIGSVLEVQSEEANEEGIRGNTSCQIPVIHWRDATPPLVLCVAMGRTNGAFEGYVQELVQDQAL
eukprot:CAMPEP_0117659536 /NCGR_PEP_ID=MMETSP0804-20121206/6486_1 /TAXON_ID=1074897 /ORGANISM="Tetraselmis astigmatica, Strain CCMP880" /LENGTH=867 /DNA_ID=CAMNT_0005466203 /DNA_START=78 /DNA_END=2683 /DNA_ORIENTATION=+